MTTKRLFIGVLAAGAVAGMFFWLRPDEDQSRVNEDASRPMFANRKVASAEFGGRSGWYIDSIILNNGTTIQYAEKENILVAGVTDSPNELLLMPGPQGDGMVAGYRDKTIHLPLWKNAAILFDRNGLVRVIYLQNVKAKYLFSLIETDHAQFEKIFGSPPAL